MRVTIVTCMLQYILTQMLSLVSLVKSYVTTESTECVLQPRCRLTYPIHGVSHKTHEVCLMYGDADVIVVPGIVMYIDLIEEELHLVLLNVTDEPIEFPSYQRIAKIGVSHVCSHTLELPSLATPLAPPLAPPPPPPLATPSQPEETHTLKVMLDHPSALLPFKSSKGAACYDLYSVNARDVLPGKRELFSTGLRFGIPSGYCVRILSRSGLALRNGIDVQAGIIDSDYRGIVGVLLHNTSTVPFSVTQGNKIAQMMFVKLPDVSIVRVSSLDATDRGEGGFGSTGK